MIWIDEEALKAAMNRAGVDTFTALAEKGRHNNQNIVQRAAWAFCTVSGYGL